MASANDINLFLHKNHNLPYKSVISQHIIYYSTMYSNFRNLHPWMNVCVHVCLFMFECNMALWNLVHQQARGSCSSLRMRIWLDVGLWGVMAANHVILHFCYIYNIDYHQNQYNIYVTNINVTKFINVTKLCSIVNIRLCISRIQLIEILNKCCKKLYWCREKFNTILFIFFTTPWRILSKNIYLEHVEIMSLLFQIHEQLNGESVDNKT